MTHPFTTFYIIRHGESEGNVQHILQGQIDFPLTPQGEAQALARSQSLRDIAFDMVFSSDLLRAHKTAEILAEERNLTVAVTKALRERCFGKFEGLSDDVLNEEARAIFDRWYHMTDDQWMKHRIDPQAETGEEIVYRFMRFIREIAVTHPGKTVLAVSHGDIMRNMLIHLGWGTRDELGRGAIHNTGYVVLNSDGSDIAVVETKGVVKTS